MDKKRNNKRDRVDSKVKPAPKAGACFREVLTQHVAYISTERK